MYIDQTNTFHKQSMSAWFFKISKSNTWIHASRKRKTCYQVYNYILKTMGVSCALVSYDTIE